MTDARVYLRVSRGDEKAILRNQERAALVHVKDRGYRLAGVYREVASGADPARVVFNQFLHDLGPGEVAVFTALSRVTRGGTHAALDILRALETRGVRWNFVEQPFLNVDEHTPQMVRDVMIAILAGLDKDYRDRISAKTKETLRKKKAAGVKLGRPRGSKDKRPRQKRLPKSFLQQKELLESGRFSIPFAQVDHAGRTRRRRGKHDVG